MADRPSYADPLAPSSAPRPRRLRPISSDLACLSLLLFAVGLLAYSVGLFTTGHRAAQAVEDFARWPLALGLLTLLLAGMNRVVELVVFAGREVRRHGLRGALVPRDERPVPRSSGRRMLRVFGGLARRVGVVGLIVGALCGMAANRSALAGSLGVVLVGVGVASVLLIVFGLAAAFVDGVIEGLTDPQA